MWRVKQEALLTSFILCQDLGVLGQQLGCGIYSGTQNMGAYLFCSLDAFVPSVSTRTKKLFAFGGDGIPEPRVFVGSYLLSRQL